MSTLFSKFTITKFLVDYTKFQCEFVIESEIRKFKQREITRQSFIGVEILKNSTSLVCVFVLNENFGTANEII